MERKETDLAERKETDLADMKETDPTYNQSLWNFEIGKIRLFGSFRIRHFWARSTKPPKETDPR